MLPTRYYSKRQEKQVAKLVDGNTTSNSGAANFCAGDVIGSDNTLYECKTVTKQVKSYAIKKEVLDKIQKEAFAMKKSNAVMAFNFEPDGELFFVLRQKHYKELLELIQNKL